MSALLDLASAKLQINNPDDTDNTEMQVFVDAAVEMVEGVCGPVDARACTDTFGPHGPWLLSTLPVLAITSITSAAGAVDLAMVTVDLGSGVLHGAQYLPPPTVVAYSAGRTDVPSSLKLAARIIFAHLWRTQRGTSARSRTAGANDDGMVAGMGWAIPYRAADLMRRYRRPPAIA